MHIAVRGLRLTVNMYIYIYMSYSLIKLLEGGLYRGSYRGLPLGILREILGV